MADVNFKISFKNFKVNFSNVANTNVFYQQYSAIYESSVNDAIYEWMCEHHCPRDQLTDYK